MTSEFGLRGPKTPWVCPNDRQLALRAKLQTGWSVKTSQFNTYPKPQPLTDSEQQMIVSVIKKAEELDLTEQKRVGKLVDRLESLKRLASGNGITECILCGDSFGLSVFGRTNYRCSDCKKAVCRKCVVELSTVSPTGSGIKDPVLRLCKICSENRELIKRSGAWFYKGVPNYILPEKKSPYGNNFENKSTAASTYQEKRYLSRYLNSHLSNSSSGPSTGASSTGGGGGITGASRRIGILWSRSLSGRSQSEGENDSSSGDETGASATAAKASSEKFLRQRLNSDARKPSRSSNESSSVPAGGQPRSSSSLLPPGSVEDHLYEISDPSSSEGCSGGMLKQKSFERFDLSGSIDQTVFNDNNPRSSGSSSNDCLVQSSATASQTSASSSSILHSPHGIIELSLLYDDTHQALHCSLHKAKDLTPTDVNGLSDPYSVLKLIPSRFEGAHHRTKTVHKTLQPVFNETLTFYGLLQTDLAWQTLQINVMDDDRWGRDCLGSVQIPLHRIRPQQTRFFTLSLERGRLNEDKEWGRGRLLLSLSYMTEKSLLLVGVLRAQDLPALDHSGCSDPFVKIRLLHDANFPLTTSSCPSINRKYKTSVKWKTLNPEFHEEFSLKVSILDLPRLALVISVWDKDLGKNNDYIGGIVLSYGSKGERLKHWSDMIKLPNTKHTKWHTLCPSELPAH